MFVVFIFIFLADVFFIGVQSTAVSLLGQVSSIIGGDESRIRCPKVVAIRNGAAKILNSAVIFRSGHVQFMQQGGDLVMRVLHGCEIRPTPGTFHILGSMFFPQYGLFFHSHDSGLCAIGHLPSRQIKGAPACVLGMQLAPRITALHIHLKPKALQLALIEREHFLARVGRGGLRDRSYSLRRRRFQRGLLVISEPWGIEEEAASAL